MYIVKKASLILLIALICFTSTSNAFCPVSFLPGTVICGEGGEFNWAGPGYPSDIINPNSQMSVSITGGCPPYTWLVSGEGYWLENDLTYYMENIVYTDSEIDCFASITVVDKYGNRVTGSLRKPGRWVGIGNSCQLPGPATKHLGYNRYQGWQFERIQGKYRQYQSYRTEGFSGTCLWTEPPCGNQKHTCDPWSNPGNECITLESTGLINGFDRKVYPCAWQSPEMSEEEFGGFHKYCTDLGAMGWTSMQCFLSKSLRTEEWRCD